MDISNLTPDQQAQLAALLGQQNQQSIDPSQLGQQPTPSLGGNGGSNADSDAAPDIHPATNLIGKAVMDHVMGRTTNPQLSRVPIQGGPNFWQRFGSAMLGHPVDPTANSVIATNQAPMPNTYGIPQPTPIAPGQYDYAALQKYAEDQAKVAQNQSIYGIKNPIPPPTVAAKLADGDIVGAQQEAQKLGIPFANQWMTMGATVKGANAKALGADAQTTRATTQNNKFWEDAGTSLAGLKGNVTFTQQAGKVSSGFHIAQLLDSAYNDKTGEFDLSPSQYGELVLNGAAMLTGSSNFTNEQMQTVRQMTAKGQVGSALTFLTGTPFNGNTQAVIKQMAQLAIRQGTVAQDLRDQMINGANGALAQAKATNPTAYKRTVENALGKAPDLRMKLNSSPWVSAIGGLPSNTVTPGQTQQPQGPIHIYPSGKKAIYINGQWQPFNG